MHGLLTEFKEKTNNKEKATKLLLLEINDNSDKCWTNWSNSNEIQRQLTSMDPNVVLNIYHKDDDIYDYKNLNNAYKLSDEDKPDLINTLVQTLENLNNAYKLSDEEKSDLINLINTLVQTLGAYGEC